MSAQHIYGPQSTQDKIYCCHQIKDLLRIDDFNTKVNSFEISVDLLDFQIRKDFLLSLETLTSIILI